MTSSSIPVYSILIGLFYLSGISSQKQTWRETDTETVKVTIKPRRLHVFQSSVRITFNHASTVQGNITRLIRIKILNKNSKEVEVFNKSVHLFSNSQTFSLEVPCDTFSQSGRYNLHYFVEGLTKSFIQSRKKIVVRTRREKIRIHAPRSHIARNRTVSIWIITRKRISCKPYRDKVQVYWIKGINDHILVTTKKVGKAKVGKQMNMKFPCNIFDTQGTFYFKYISGYNNRTLARSNNMSVSWGEYQLNPQSDNIFPCTTTFAIEIRSPYCATTEDKVEIWTKDFDNMVRSQPAYPGFRFVYFTCNIFKEHIRHYCFRYITKSSLTKEENIQAIKCLPSRKAGAQLLGWSEWYSWGACSSARDCGQGKKYRLRTCLTLPSIYQDTQPQCNGPYVEAASCTQPPCLGTDCETCGCVLSNAAGTVVSPESLPWSFAKNKSNCHWWIRVDANKKIKLWFDTLSLSENAIIKIIDGNGSHSKILKRITNRKQKDVRDMLSSSNVITIRYYFNRNLNKTNLGFQLSYSSFDDTPTNSHESSSSASERKKLLKMAFTGLLSLMIVAVAVIFFGVFCKIQRQQREPNSQITLGKAVSSFNSSTACVTESTVRSFYEPPISGDEGVNNNLSPQRVTSNYRPRVCGQVPVHSRPYIHVCRKCSYQPEEFSFEYVDNSHNEGQMKLNNHRTFVDIRREKIRHSYSTSSLSSEDDEGDYPIANYL